jgi:hypothetical protein
MGYEMQAVVPPPDVPLDLPLAVDMGHLLTREQRSGW